VKIRAVFGAQKSINFNSSHHLNIAKRVFGMALPCDAKA
jgi:hypothetical protein